MKASPDRHNRLAEAYRSSETGVARVNRAAASRMMRQHLADEEHLVTPSFDGLADDVFGSAIGRHLGGVDEPHPEVEPKPKRRDLSSASAPA